MLRAVTYQDRVTAETLRPWLRRSRFTMIPSTLCTSPDVNQQGDALLHSLFNRFLHLSLFPFLSIVSSSAAKQFWSQGAICQSSQNGWPQKNQPLPAVLHWEAFGLQCTEKKKSNWAIFNFSFLVLILNVFLICNIHWVWANPHHWSGQLWLSQLSWTLSTFTSSHHRLNLDMSFGAGGVDLACRGGGWGLTWMDLFYSFLWSYLYSLLSVFYKRGDLGIHTITRSHFVR